MYKPMTKAESDPETDDLDQPDWTVSAGQADNPLVVLLHGAGASAEIWSEHLSALSETYRVIAVDLPGHRNHPSEAFSYEAASETVRSVITREGQSAVLVGHSIGGYVSAKIVEDHPDLVDGVFTSGSYLNWRRGKGLVLSVLYGYVLAPIMKGGSYSELWKRMVVDRLSLDEYESDMASQKTVYGAATAMQASAFTEVWAGLETFDGPVLVGAGREEPLADDYGPRLAEQADVTFEYMPYDGHNGPISHPEAFVSVIERFIRDQSLGAE
jgi:pimeloyl-ACP methyl ester carboxylesterase